MSSSGFALRAPLLALSAAVLLAAAPPQVQPGIDLAGTVTDIDGRPLPGATVYVYTAGPRQGIGSFCPSCYVDCGKRQVTDARGRFRLPSLDRSLLFRILTVSEGYEPAFTPKVDPLQGEIGVKLRKTDLSREDPQRRVTGRVLDPSGQPVVGATVEPVGFRTLLGEGEFGETPGLDALAITNGRGEFRFRVPEPGVFAYALINARGLAPRVVADLTAGSGRPHDVTLPLGTTLMGSVRNSSGQGVPDAVVHVVPTELRIEQFTKWQEIATDADGRFTLPNVPADREYRVATRMDSLIGAGVGTAGRTVLAGKDGTVTGGLELTALPATVLAGQVVLTDGKPVPPGTQILLSRQGTWDAQTAILDAGGRFRFQAVPREETMGLFVRVPGYHIAASTKGFDPGRRQVETCVPSTSPAPELRIELIPDAGS
jgi:protocatechuate 3,4-dioxygenase beta subunit